jgi:hypothetical protein
MGERAWGKRSVGEKAGLPLCTLPLSPPLPPFIPTHRLRQLNAHSDAEDFGDQDHCDPASCPTPLPSRFSGRLAPWSHGSCRSCHVGSGWGHSRSGGPGVFRVLGATSCSLSLGIVTSPSPCVGQPPLQPCVPLQQPPCQPAGSGLGRVRGRVGGHLCPQEGLFGMEKRTLFNTSGF